MNFDNKKIMPRFFVVIVLMSLGGLYILGNAAYLMFVESEYWTQERECAHSRQAWKHPFGRRADYGQFLAGI